MFGKSSQKKKFFKRIASIVTAAVCSASMFAAFLGSPLTKNGVQNVIVAEAASVLDGAEFITSSGALQKNHWYMSPNGRHGLIFQGSDGNLVLYHFNDNGTRTPYWATSTERSEADLCQLQGDGNFVIYDKYRRPLWCTDTYRTPATLYINNSGELFIYSRSVRGKVWSSFNSRGIRIYQPPKTPVQTTTPKPVHSHNYNFYQENNKVVWKCPGCGRIDHEVGFREYAEKRVDQDHTYKDREQALRRYLELIGTDSSRIDEAVKAYKAVNNLNESEKTGVREFLDGTDDINTNLLPDCQGKDFVEKCQVCNKVLSVYDLFNSTKQKSVDINTMNALIGALQTAVSFCPLGDSTYGEVLKGIQKSMKEAIKAGIKYNTRSYLSSLNDDYNESFTSDFWASEVTTRTLNANKIYKIDGLGYFTVLDYMNYKFGKDGFTVYQTFVNIKCIQEATGQDFWDLVDMI